MPIIDQIVGYHEEMTAWRRDLHAHPETAFEEFRTSDFVAAKLQEFGVEIDRGLAGTGVVGTLHCGDGPAIGLRADMDALHIHEENEFAHRSTIDGKMHACGHDGHTIMLLGAARYLAETRNFTGTVQFVFQPAEENEGGGRVMVEEGLFDKFPMQAIYGMHNWPQMPAGEMAVKAGPVMSAVAFFEMEITGKGTHGAMPHTGIDPVLAAAEIVVALQSIASRNIDPQDAVVISVTKFSSGDTLNSIPSKAILGGTTRGFEQDVLEAIEPSMKRIAEGVAAAHGASVRLDYRPFHPATVNHPAETEIAARAAVNVVGADKLDRNPPASMGSEDFAHMLQATPGCYIWIGNDPGDDRRMIHTPTYDFNDEILPIGASYWARLVEMTMV